MAGNDLAAGREIGATYSGPVNIDRIIRGSVKPLTQVGLSKSPVAIPIPENQYTGGGRAQCTVDLVVVGDLVLSIILVTVSFSLMELTRSLVLSTPPSPKNAAIAIPKTPIVVAAETITRFRLLFCH